MIKIYSIIAGILLLILFSKNIYSQNNYLTQDGDSLWNISILFYGSPYYWTAIWDANKQIMPDPNIVPAGVYLKIPELTKAQLKEAELKTKQQVKVKSHRGKWIKTNGPNSENEIYSLASSGTNIFVGTKNGLYLSTDIGNTWSYISFNNDVYSLAIDGSNIFAGTNRGLYLSSDNGLSWSSHSNFFQNVWVMSILINNSNIIIGSLGKGIFLSIDYGKTYWPWLLVEKSNKSLTINSLISSGINIFAGARDNYTKSVFASTDNGINWTATALDCQGVSSLTAIDSNIFAGTYNIYNSNKSGVYHSKNNGQTWNLTSLNNIYISSLVMIESNIFAAVQDCNFGPKNGVYYSTNYGQDWVKMNKGFDDQNYTYIKCFSLTNEYLFAAEVAQLGGGYVYKYILSDF